MMDRYEYSAPTMGTMLKLVVYSEEQTTAEQWIDACLNEIERLIPIFNNYSAQSEISQLNARCGSQTRVSKDLYRLIEHARFWHEISGRAFDATCGSLFELWRQARKTQRVPSGEEQSQALGRCGWQHVECATRRLSGGQDAECLVTVHRPGLILDPSGIATGYIIDLAVDRMTQAGCRSYLIDIGGDIRLGQAPPNKRGWRVQVAGLGKNSPPLMELERANCSLTTSGDRNQSLVIGGQSYSHLIDPRTGQPLRNHQSCTVLADTATAADAGATALSILGREQSASKFEVFPIEEAYLITSQAESEQVDHPPPFYCHLTRG